MIRSIYLVVAFIVSSVMCLSSQAIEHASTYTIDITKGEYNRIVLPTPFAQAVVSKGALIDKPLKRNGGRLLLVRPKKNALKTFNITFILENGETFQLYMNPVSKDKAIVWRYKDAADVQDDVGNTLNDKHLWLSRLFPQAHDLYYGRAEEHTTAPKGFTKIKIGNVLKAAVKDAKTNGIATITLAPKMAWRGMGHVLQAYQLSSDLPIEIEPSDFWFESVVAVSTEFDFVSKSKKPYVLILTKDN